MNALTMRFRCWLAVADRVKLYARHRKDAAMLLDALPNALSDALMTSTSTFALIALAEIGDKSQLVCMTLATRHRQRSMLLGPVLLGAAVAFSLLNALAVLFGAGVAAWVPERIAAGIVAVLFFGFALHALRHSDDDDGDDDDADVKEKPGHGIFVTTLVLLFVAEFGDKTQIAVAGLAGSLPPLPVWLGATAALIGVSALGVWAGRTVLQRLSLVWLHRLGAGLFFLFAIMAGARALGFAVI